MSAIEIQHLKKVFGDKVVLEDVCLSVPKGSIFGFVGENGSGKTTTMKCLLGLLKPEAGTLLIDGEPVTYGETKTNQKIGYLPDVPEFYDYMTAKEYLQLCGDITATKNKSYERLLESVGLKVDNQKIGNFSRGMKQRLGLAQALLNEPEILICDEPTSALDPMGRKEFLDLLSSLENTTVLFSTHILADVERICDQVAILHQGKIPVSGNLEKMKQAHSSYRYQLEFDRLEEAVRFAKTMTSYGMINEQQEKRCLVHDSETWHQKQAILTVLQSEQLFPLSMEQLAPSLEELFLEVVR